MFKVAISVMDSTKKEVLYTRVVEPDEVVEVLQELYETHQKISTVYLVDENGQELGEETE